MIIIYDNIVIQPYMYKEEQNKVIMEYTVRDGYTHIEVPKDKITIIQK